MERLQMNARNILLVSLLALVFLGSAATAGDAPFFFIQIADPQLGFSTKDADIAPDVANLDRAVEIINRLRPAFVVFNGDLVNKPHDPRQIRAFWRSVREVDPQIPLRFLPGNHDVAGATAADIRSYEKLFGNDHYSFSHNGSVFIVLNTLLLGKSGDAAMRDVQRKWFESELSAAVKNKAAHIFVCNHQPWFLQTREEADRYENVPLAHRLEYLDLMKQHKVGYALSGHLHYDLVAKDGALTIVAGGPLSKAAAKKPQIVGLRIWKVYKDRVDTQFYPLDSVPAAVRL